MTLGPVKVHFCCPMGLVFVSDCDMTSADCKLFRVVCNINIEG